MRLIFHRLERRPTIIRPGCVVFILIFSGIAQAQLPMPGGGGWNIPQAGDSIQGSEPGADKKEQIINLPAKITKLEASCLSLKGMQLGIRGSNLGSGKESSIRLKGKQLKIDAWSNSRIKVRIPAGKYGHESIELWQGGKRITKGSIRGCAESKKFAKPDPTSPTKGGALIGGRFNKTKPATTDLALTLRLQATGNGKQTQAIVTAINKGPATAKGYSLALFPSHSAKHQPSSIKSLSPGSLANSTQKKIAMALAPKANREHVLLATINQSMAYLCASIQSHTTDKQPGNNVACQPVKGLTATAEGGPQPEPPGSPTVSNAPAAGGFGSAVPKMVESKGGNGKQPSSKPLQSGSALALAKRMSEQNRSLVAKQLKGVGSQTYRHLTMAPSSDGARLLIANDQPVKGMILMRDAKTMKNLAKGLFDDGQGSLVAMGALSPIKGKEIPFTVTYTPWGENILGLDRNRDGLVDVAIGSRGRDKRWMMFGEDTVRFQLCMEQLASSGDDHLEIAALCGQCLDPASRSERLTAGERNCVNRERSARYGGGGGIGGGLITGADGFAEPNCGPIDGGIAAEGGRKRPDADSNADRLRQEAKWHRQEAERARQALRDPNTSIMREADLIEVARAHEQSEREYDNLANERSNLDAVEAIEGRIPVIESRNIAFERNLHRVNQRARQIRTFGPRRRGRSGGTSQPGIGPDGEPQMAFEDPRCGSSTKAFWDMCGKADSGVDCLQGMSSAYGLTGGRCRTETGPDDEEILVCYGQEVDPRRGGQGDTGGGVDGGRPSVGGSDSGPTEARMPQTGGGGPGRMIDYTPLGGFIMALCAGGGCPDETLQRTTNARQQ